jgi:hypothetical protein
MIQVNAKAPNQRVDESDTVLIAIGDHTVKNFGEGNRNVIGFMLLIHNTP